MLCHDLHRQSKYCPHWFGYHLLMSYGNFFFFNLPLILLINKMQQSPKDTTIIEIKKKVLAGQPRITAEKHNANFYA